MDEAEFDRSVVAAVFEQAALRGWAEVSLVEAAVQAGLDLKRLRARFPGKAAVLLRLGVMADQAALSGVTASGTPRERLFDAVMNRFEVLQQHRDGVVALLAALRTDPGIALLLYGATLRSMAWLLEASGVPTTGITGQLRVHGMLALWLYALRAWERDESADLSSTMAAVDRGLDQAIRTERSLPGREPEAPLEAEPPSETGPKPMGEEPSPAGP